MFHHKGKLFIFLGSFLIVLYGVSAAFYAKDDDAYKELSVFINALSRIRADYVEEPDMNNVQEGAMRGLLDALDPYCSFLSKEQYNALQKRKENGKAGVGLILSKRSDVIYVVSCERDGPAAAAGVRPGDYMIAIDGSEVEDKSVLEADTLLRGSPGSKVKVSLFRNSRTKVFDVEMTRSEQAASPVNYKMLDRNVGLLNVSSLSDAAVEQAKVKLKTIISAGAEKIILDLRDCAEGSASNGADLANYFIRSGILYYSQNRQGERVRVVEASSEKHITDLPLAVLIDGSTAGAAEIAAGALKDQKRATVIGEKSFGSGADQKTIQLKSGAVLILSTAKYYTPGGKVIQDEAARNAGILPDVEAPDLETRQDLAVESYYDEKGDAVDSRKVVVVLPEKDKPARPDKDDKDDTAKYKQFQEKIDKIQIEKALEILSKMNSAAKKAA
jgi:carboxyl-terminal processing protease